MLSGLKSGLKTGLGAPIVTGRRLQEDDENVVLLNPNVAFNCSSLGGGGVIIEAANSLFPISLPQIGGTTVTVSESILYLGNPTLNFSSATGGFRGDTPTRDTATPLAPGPFTFEAWIRPTVNGVALLDGRNVNGLTQFGVTLASNSNINVWDGVNSTEFTGATLTLSQWNHIAIQWEPSGGSNRVWRVYTNGLQSSTVTTSRSSNTAGTRISLGTHIDTSLLPSFRGQLGQCAFWHELRYSGNYTPPDNIYAP